METIFWDSESVLFIYFLEGRKTITESYYVQALRKLKAELLIAKKRQKSSIVESPSIMKTPERILHELQKMFRENSDWNCCLIHLTAQT